MRSQNGRSTKDTVTRGNSRGPFEYEPSIESDREDMVATKMEPKFQKQIKKKKNKKLRKKSKKNRANDQKSELIDMIND